ncbi:DNA replication protein [Photobacterium damselae subsp. damselae]|uniref:DNA replication protein n=1 Tax=Photobacterium damselae TaxID=38293 RepID=UPI00084AF7B7|nr:DNA replication protein [Photobacterium damselae]OEC82459.1 DNA replication protein [Photobacterium damselae subsp. damselae]
MGSQNQIKSKLLELEGGKFQRLCDDWLHRKGFENINPIGMMDTTDRVVKGTPDCLLMQENGKYIFSEYTVQQDRLANKLTDDINKCFDENKTSISADKISEIIICYLGKLSTQEINQLRTLCYDRGVMLTLYGLDSISLSIKNSYPVLSETYLDLPLDTGQLLSVNDFIERYGRSNFTTSIDNELLFCDDLLSNMVRILESSNFLLVSGAAGLGKTLFSVTLAKRILQENENINVICLFDKGADLIRDITAYFSEPGDYLIFIDDANRLDNRLDYILHYLTEKDENRSFRIVATVRDYARTSVIEKVSKYTVLHEQVITPLTDEQIKELVESLFGIKNGEYQKRIQEISCGNPRLAVMASKVAIETNQIQSIQNVTSLYSDYFGENDNVKLVLEDERLVLAACAISFFRKVDKLNEQQMRMVESSFGIQSEEFWELVDVLHKNELVDLYENEVVKISDQILSTYLFYMAAFEKNIISFSSIVKDFYPDYTKTIVDSLNPIISAFDQRKVVAGIRSEIKDIFEMFCENESIGKSIEFLNTFWFALPTEALIYASNTINNMLMVDIDWKNEPYEESKSEADKSSLVSLLTNFRFYGEQEFQISFELLLEYLVKSKASLGYVIRALFERYNFKPDDCRYGYYVQSFVVDKLVEQMKSGENYLFSRLFILLANCLLKVEHQDQQWSRGDSISIIRFKLTLDEYLLSLREKIISSLSVLMAKDEFSPLVIEVFKEYVGRVRYEGVNMVEADLPFIARYLIKNLDEDNLSHCVMMQDYCEHLDSLEVDYPKEWNENFFNETLKLSHLLLEDRHEQRMLKMDYEEYNQHRHKVLVEHFTGISLTGFIEFIERCKRLNNALSGRDRDYRLKHGIEASLRAMAESVPEIFPDIISEYIDYDDFFEVTPYGIVTELFKTQSRESVFFVLNSKEYRWKKLWLSTYFSLLPEESIVDNDVNLLIEHINKAQSNELVYGLDYLNKYKRIDDAIYCKVVRILTDKSTEDANYAGLLEHLFSRYSSMFGNWFEVFNWDEELVFDAYLAAYNLERCWDYSGDALKLLLDRNFDFLYRFVDKIYEKERWPNIHTDMPDVNFLWEREAYIQEIEDYAKYLHSKDEHAFRYRENIFSKLFIKERGGIESEDMVNKKYDFFRNAIKRNATDTRFMCFLFNSAQLLSEKFRRELLGLFLSENDKFKDFQMLDYELTTRVWSGSRVPILEREKNFLESLLPLFNSIQFLEHKFYVEGQIEDKLKSIEYEKKRDYLEGR